MHKHPAVQTLIGFITAMNEWERAVIARNFKRMSDLRRAEKPAGPTRGHIPGVLRAGARPGGLTEMNWGLDHPEYNPKTEKIVSVSPGRTTVVVQTYMPLEDLKMRYELIRKADRWFLRDHRKCYDPDVRKWCYCQL